MKQLLHLRWQRYAYGLKDILRKGILPGDGHRGDNVDAVAIIRATAISGAWPAWPMMRPASDASIAGVSVAVSQAVAPVTVFPGTGICCNAFITLIADQQ